MIQDPPLAEIPDSLTPPGRRSLADHLIAGNYFYFLSAALMLLGCKWMMMTTPFGPAIFTRTLKTLLILQGYEMLVILTALAIVRHFRALDDAFSLLLIELILLLDPTFFSNSFFTMLKTERAMLNWNGVLVNAACLGLVPLKLWILERGLKLRFSAGAWVAVLFAGLYAYLAEAPLCRRVPLPGMSDTAYHYLLAWGPLVFAVLMPAARAAVAPAPGAELPESRRLAIGGLLAGFPLVIIGGHFIECARVHDLFFYPFEFAPAVLALAVVIVRQPEPGRAPVRKLLLVCDVCVAIALAFTLIRRLELESRAVLGYAARPLPAFAALHVPMALTATGAIGLYFWFHRRFACRAALARIALLAVAGGIYGLARNETVHHGVFAFGLGVRDAVVAGAHACKHAGAWCAGLARAAGLVCLPAFEFALAWKFEILQGGILLYLAVNALRKKPLGKEDRAIWLVVLLVFGLIRLANTAANWCAVVCGAEFALLLALSFLSRWRGYMFLAALQLVFFIFLSEAAEVPFAKDVNAWLTLHPAFAQGGLWLGLVVLAVLFPHPMTWFPLGLLTIWIGAGLLPGGRRHWIPEMIQGVFIIGLLLDHRFNREANRFARVITAAIVLVIAQCRYFDDPALWAGLVIAAQCVLLLSAAAGVHEPGYALLSLAQAGGFIFFGWRTFHLTISPPVAVIGAALALFAAGILVTFNKGRLQRWLTPPPPPPLPPLPPPPMTSTAIPPNPTIDQFAERYKTSEVEEAAEEAGLPEISGAALSEADHLRATLDLLFNTDPPLGIGQREDFPAEALERLDAATQGQTGRPPVYLVKGDPAAGCVWQVVPAWICYPAGE